MADKVNSLSQLEKQVQSTRERDLAGSLESCKEQLRDAYMNFKDLQQRCIIDMKEKGSKMETGIDEHTVFYFKPETFTLDDPEKQKAHRESLLKKIGNLPKPEPISYLGDELHRNMCQTLADRSTPKQTKTMLAQFFYRRQYQLQHMKYKLLCRWAHHTLTSETLEMISSEASFMFGKLEYNLEQAMTRWERLSQNDYFDTAKPENRPSTKADLGEGTLYVENFDIQAQSLIREDDIEVFVRATTYRNKINKVINKFFSRLKWFALHNRYKIFEKAIEQHNAIKDANIKRQLAIYDRVKTHFHKSQITNADLEHQLNEVLKNYHCKRYQRYFLSENDQILYKWKANHDEVPRLIGDNQLLKLKILDTAAIFNLTGDIELDKGYSFSYQVSVFFPSYFLKQIVKSQFSVYDAFENLQENIDPEKRTTNTMTYIDSNIFSDVSTAKNALPNDEGLQSEFKEAKIKIIRLKSAAYWLYYVALTPNEPQWLQNQQAILNGDNSIDSILKSAFNFLDVNDMTSVNRINEDSSHQHRETVTRLRKHDPHNQIIKVALQTNDGEKHIDIDTMPFMNSAQDAANIQQHLLNAVQDHVKHTDEDKRHQQTQQQSIYSLPQHLLSSYYTLRFMESRDSKTRLMYSLNYFRSIQKRLALDLREFATRDRIDGQSQTPFVQSREANQIIINQINMSTKQYQNKVPVSDSLEDGKNRMTVFDTEVISSLKDMATLRNYKENGLFNNRVFTTCPALPAFHATHGEPIVHQPVNEEQDAQKNSTNISENAVKLMGRIDFVEIDESLEEVYIKDDFGIYILYDCVLQDMKFLEDELCKVGSFYLHKSEVLIDPKSKPIPCRDRQELVADLLRKEALFAFNKVKLVQVYMECYEHISDPLEQQKLMQIITDIMASRPRLNLKASYFIDAYDGEIKLLKKQFELVKMLVDLQVTLEKTENNRLQESLNLSFTLANLYSKDRWQYQDAESLLVAVERTRQQKREAEIFAQKREQEIRDAEKSILEQDETTDGIQNNLDLKTEENLELEESQHLDEENYLQQDDNQFTQLLGLPQISIESIYQSYREKDQNVLKIMREHSNFITVYEGYPEFLTMLTHKSILDHNRIFKVNQWSQPTGALDFYDSLDFINKFYALSQQIQQDLYDNLKVWDATLMIEIDYQVAELGIEEFRQVINYCDNTQVEYLGRELVEDESIMGNSDKLIFFAKEMFSDLSFKPKHMIDPFLVAKLDVQTIYNFKFPVIETALNKYTMRKNGIAGIEYMMQAEKQAVTEIAKGKASEEDDKVGGKTKVADVLNRRNIMVPSLLQTYCNMTELLRLRQEIIIAVTECSYLKQIYVQQCECIGQRDTRVELNEGIIFAQQEYDLNSVNFFEDGPSHQERIELAIREFDPNLISNFNFRNPDSFKINILTAGLEEVRAILHYQLMQKHLLIVATRINSFIVEPYLKAFSELDIIANLKFIVPNGIIDFSQLVNQPYMPIQPNTIKNLKLSYKQLASSNCQPIFFNIIQMKSQSRSSISKEFTTYQDIVQNSMVSNPSPYCVSRIMRCYRVKLLTKFVQKTLTEIYLDAQKVQALHTCNRLRFFNRFFKVDAQSLGTTGEPLALFKFETSNFIESTPFNYLTEDKKEPEFGNKKVFELKVINKNDYQILDHFGIPSSATLLSIDASPMEDIRIFKAKQKECQIKYWGIEQNDELKDHPAETNEPEVHLKLMLPTYSPYEQQEKTGQKKHSDEVMQSQTGSMLNYEEALYFGDSKYAAMSRFYVYLERIITIEWFIKQLQLKPEEVIDFNHAVECGLTFFKTDGFDQRVIEKLAPIQNSQGNEKTKDYFINEVEQLRKSHHVAETIHSLAVQIKNFIMQYTKTKLNLRQEYISEYTEFRYQQIIGSLHRLTQQYYIKKNLVAVRKIQTAIAQLTKMDHLRVVYLKPSNYSVKECCVSPQLQCLESGNIIFGSITKDDQTNFLRCVKPIVNQKSLEPPQISLFHSLFQYDQTRQVQPSQFAGQILSTNSGVPFYSLCTALIGLKANERKFCQNFIISTMYHASDFIETVYNDTSLKLLTNEDVYNMEQLVFAKKFINESSSALLLKQALICWMENSTLPATSEQYELFEQNFRQNFFWKQMQQKEEIVKKTSMISQYGKIPTKSELQVLKVRINNLVEDQNISTEDELKKRDELVKALKEEFNCLKKKVTLDDYFNTKADVQVFQKEIEKLMIMASVRTLESESSALAKCFTIQVPSIQYHIHPFQQFAATFFDKVDPNLHLDVSNKINSIQELLTKIRNRGTEVQTLTSGPGIVLTIKDINEIMIDFCRTAITENLKQQKSRNELAQICEGNLRSLLYVKDQKIKNLENRISNIGTNLDNIINSRQYEKGNQLIYELDSSNRILNIFKGTMFDLEAGLTQKILGEQFNKFKRKNNQVEMKNQKFNDYQEHIFNMIGHDFATEQDRIKTILKEKAEQAKNIDSGNQKKIVMYPANGATQLNKTTKVQSSYKPDFGQSSTLSGAVVPTGFKHYNHCVCYVPNKKYPWPTLELAELDMLSEQEARGELARLCILIRKQRLLYRTKEMCLMTKYQNKINLLENQQHSNMMLWDQLAESERRERALKQELAQSQKNVATAQKTIEAMQGDIKQLEAEKFRLQKFKNNKSEKIKELEDVVKKIEVSDNLDSDKLIRVLTKKDTELKALQIAKQTYDQSLNALQKRNDIELRKYKKQFVSEQARTLVIIEKMDQLKLELKLLEQNDSSVTSIWKKKCLDLFEVCQSIKKENEELRVRCYDLISQGIHLTENMGKFDDLQPITQKSLSTTTKGGLIENQQNSKQAIHTSISRGKLSKNVTSHNILEPVEEFRTCEISNIQALKDTEKNVMSPSRNQTSQLYNTNQPQIMYNSNKTQMLYTSSGNIGSEVTHNPSEGIMQSTARGINSPEMKVNRSRSNMLLTQTQTVMSSKSLVKMRPSNQQVISPSPYPQFSRPHDIKSILNQSTEMYSYENTAKKMYGSEQNRSGSSIARKNMQFQNALQRRQIQNNLNNESGFQPYTHVSSETQLVNTNDAIIQLRSVNRFSRQMQQPGFDLHGTGYSLGYLSPLKRSESKAGGRKNQKIQVASDQIYGQSAMDIEIQTKQATPQRQPISLDNLKAVNFTSM